ncbi:MAG: hypothetical protein ISS55_01255 [Dehalococcoidales bacterium]|nr:hypothetical protein [Dehalococcoidales bacterium]
MELNDKVTQLEDEIKILKNEVQAVLLDLRESYLNFENPVSRELPPFPEQHIVISNPPQSQPTGNGSHKAGPENHTSNKPSVADEPTHTPEPAREASSSHTQEPLYKPELTTEQQPLPEPGPKSEPEMTTESEPVSGPVVVATDETAHEEVMRAWRPVKEFEMNFESGGNGGTKGQIDLATISSLADWVADVVKRLGSKRAQSILDISEMVGFLDLELKDVLTRFIYATPGEYEGKVTTRDYLTSLKELDSILGKATKFEIALLSILCQGNDSG